MLPSNIVAKRRSGWSNIFCTLNAFDDPELTKCCNLGVFCKDRNADSALEKKAEKPKEINTRMMYKYGISKSRYLNYYNS